MVYRVPVSACPLLQDPPFAFLLVWLGVAMGYRTLRALRAPLSEVSALERGVLSAAIGLGLLQYLAFGLGVAGLLTPTAVWIGLGALMALSSADMLRVARGFARAVGRRRQNPPDRWIQIGALIVAATLALALLRAACPETNGDGLGYHLNAPKRWLQWGRMDYLPTLLHTTGPMGVQMLFTLAMAVWSDTAAKQIHFALGVLAVLAIFALGRRLRNESVGFAAAALFTLCVPANYAPLPLFSLAYVDLGVAFELVCAALAWVLWSRTQTRGWFVCAALCAGFATSFKLTMILAGAALGAAVAVSSKSQVPSSESQNSELRTRNLWAGAAFFGLSLLPALPWLARSWTMTGNPVTPVLASVLPTRDVTPEFLATFQNYFKYYVWGGGGLASWSLERRKMLVYAAMAITTAATALILWRWRDREARTLAGVVGALLLVFLSNTGLYYRYALPLVPLIYLLAAMAAGRVLSKSRWVQAGLLAVLLLNLVVYQRGVGDSVAVATGRESRADYLARSHALMPLWDYANANLPPDARILLSASSAQYYSDRICYVSSAFQQGRLRLDTWEHFLSDVRRDGLGYAIAPKPENATSGVGPDSVLIRNEMPFVQRLVREYGESLLATKEDRLYRLRLPPE